MNLKKMLSTVTLLGLLSVSTQAMVGNKASDIQLGQPAYGGSGCPVGSASASLSPDNKALSILFDEYMVEAGGFSGKRLDRKSCNIAIPVHVPQGYSVSIIDIDYRGYNALPRGAQSRFSVEYFFAGQRGPRFTKTFRGPLDEDFLLSNKLGVYANIWSKCGADVNLRVNTSMMNRVRSMNSDALSIVDSADVSAGLVYHLQWKKCNQADDFYDDPFGW